MWWAHPPHCKPPHSRITLLPDPDPQTPETARASHLETLREAYFALLAQGFSTLCLHDEFIHFPRLAAAWDYRFQAARLEESFLATAASRLRDLLSRLEQLAPVADSPETAGDLVLLRQSLTGVLRELQPGGPWETDPFLYLKAGSLAFAPLLAQSSRVARQDQENLGELLSQVARLFDWGRAQVRRLSRAGGLLREGALADARKFFHQALPAFLAKHCPREVWSVPLRQVHRSLERFAERAAGLPTDAPLARGEALLGEILTNWGFSGDLDRAAAILQEEIRESRSALEHGASLTEPGRSWPEVLECLTPDAGEVDILALYRGEVARLWGFWQQSGALPPLKGRVVVAQTPVYLKSLRSSASYAAPWGPPEEHPGYFYVTLEIEAAGHHFRHYRFLSAHETVPGHHLLDAARLSLAAPVARQYESPLFYEGWACYAETLLMSEGYLTSQADYLVYWQRRLWRALRGLADLELHRGRWDLDQGLDCLRRAGYPEATARLQALHLTLNPGYQLCYTLGLKEMLRLRNLYAHRLGAVHFHKMILGGGQLPFTLVEQRLASALAKQ